MSTGTIETAFPLTPLQEGMLYHTIRNPANGAFHVQCSALLRGVLVFEHFERAWQRAAARHGALRTFFSWENRLRPLQVVRSAVAIDIETQDWRAEGNDHVDRQWRELLREDRARGFNLQAAPLMRLTLARTTEQEHRLLWSAHHGIVDGWSALLVLDEVVRDHARLQSGDATTPAAAPGFDNFVGWMEAQDQDQASAFWQSTFANWPGTTVLPGGQRNSALHPARVQATHHMSVDATRRVYLTASRCGITVNTLLMGAWAIVLSRHAGSEDITFGVTASERPADIVNVQQAVGLYLMTVPVRAPIQGNISCRDWLRTLQHRLADARAHGAPGLAAIQRWTGRASGEALFNTLVVLQDFPADVQRISSVSADTEPDDTQELTIASASIEVPNDVPLVLFGVPGERLQLDVVHDPAMVSAELGDRIVWQVASVLERISDDPELAIEALEVLGSQEIETLREWSGANVVLSQADDVHTRFHDHASRQPHKVAIVSSDGSFTYDALHRHANRLAARLIANGAGCNSVIGILSENSAYSVAAMLACLSFGATYVVLDERAPRARLTRMLESIDVVLGARTLESLSQTHTFVPLDLSDEFRDDQHDGASHADTAAYIVFTSGSTGEPKGVLVGRRQLAISTAARDLYYTESPECFLMLSPLSVDSAVAGIYWTLCTGGTLVIPPSRAEQDIEQLTELIRAHAVTHALMVPSLARAVLEHADVQKLSSLRVLVVAGEACPTETVRMHVDRLPNVRLYNEYGPSEATVWATAARLTGPGADMLDEAVVPIGRPVPGVRLYLLDQLLRRVPIGGVGEICVGGPTVADGYIDMREASERRFVADPFNPGGRLYRTGDLGRFRKDGQLEFLGRNDDQLKIRGFRVEAGEIERALREHPTVRDVVVSLTAPPLDVRPASLVEFLARLESNLAEDLLRGVEMMS